MVNLKTVKELKRRLYVIMFSDMVGYTSMMHENVERALKNVGHYKQVLDAKTKLFDGEIIKHLGDGSITLFDSVTKAVKCALEIQIHLQNNSEFAIRISIHTGEVIFSEDDFYGDGINIASRLQNHAREGSIVFSRDIYEKIQNHPEFESTHLGKLTLKNVKENVDVYALVHPALPDNHSDFRYDKNQRVAISKGRLSLRKKQFRYLGIVSIIIFLAALVLVQINRRFKQAEINAELAALKEQYSSVDPRSGRSWSFYLKTMELRKRINDDPQLDQIWFDITTLRHIVSSPQASKVYIKPYNQPDTSWIYIGETPLYNYQFPMSLTRFRIEKEGFQSQLDVLYGLWNRADTTFYKLFKPEKYINGMVFVPGKRGNLKITPGLPSLYIDDFWIDQYEVTNKEYKSFVDSGGYKNPEYWKEAFVFENDTLHFQKAMMKFVDGTGHHAPAHWELGDYIKGTDDLPVVGISWYEAAAYAEFRKKSLPTLFHWFYVSQSHASQDLIKFANFDQQAPVIKGTFNSLARFGVYDLAGNVSEWIYNEKSGRRFVMGGNYKEPPYQYISTHYQGSPWTRNDLVGFRCIKTVNNISRNLKQPVQIISRDYGNLMPISDEEFRVFRKIFEHEPAELSPEIVSKNENQDWWEELVMLKVPYDEDPLPVKISIPKKFSPPFQPIIFMPGLGAHHTNSLDGMITNQPRIDWIPKIGRALIQPAFYSSYGRGEISISNIEKWQLTYKFMIKDAQIVCDYIKLREDLDENKIAFYGASWGGAIAPYILAIESRIKLGILALFGISPVEKYRFRQFDQVDYVPRVEIPMLLLGGRYDLDYTMEQQQSFYDLLGTPIEDKKWIVYETTHWIPRNELINESREWLDKYFGKPQR